MKRNLRTTNKQRIVGDKALGWHRKSFRHTSQEEKFKNLRISKKLFALGLFKKMRGSLRLFSDHLYFMPTFGLCTFTKIAL